MFERIRKALSGRGKTAGAEKDAEKPGGAMSFEEQYRAALAAQRKEKESLFRRDPYSPIPFDEREEWGGLRYFDPNLALRLTVPLLRAEPEPLTMETSTGTQQRYQRIGTVQFTVEGQPAELALYESPHGELFLPFRDATSGKESYGAGRYLEPIAVGEGEVLVDFNLAYNPYCAYSPDFSCPLPPIENWLKVPIRAGERTYKEEA